MKTTILLGITLTLGTALTSQAEDQTVDISQGRGQFVPYKARMPVSVVSKGVRKEPAAKTTPEPGVLRPVTIQTVRGSIVVMRKFPR